MKKGIIILIILCLAGVASFFLLERNSSPEIQPSETGDQVASAISSPDKESYEIRLPELGVKIVKSAEMSDITHETIPNTGTSLYGVVLGPAVNFKSGRLTEAFKTCSGASTNSPSVTTVYRLDGTYDPSKPDLMNSTGLLKQFPNFYLEGANSGSDGYCANDTEKNEQIQAIVDQVRKQINEAFKKAELLQ